MKKLYCLLLALMCITMAWANPTATTGMQAETATSDENLTIGQMLYNLEEVWSQIPEEKKTNEAEHIYDYYVGMISISTNDHDFASDLYNAAMSYLLSLKNQTSDDPDPEPNDIDAMLNQLSELWSRIPDAAKDSDTEHTYDMYRDMISDAAREGDMQVAWSIYYEALDFINSLVASIAAPNALDEVSAQSPVTKCILDGQVVIMKDGRRYNASGVEL